jgi:hypothetical protein
VRKQRKFLSVISDHWPMSVTMVSVSTPGARWATYLQQCNTHGGNPGNDLATITERCVDDTEFVAMMSKMVSYLHVLLCQGVLPQ